MTTVTYDGSFEGLLTAIFEVYEYKMGDVHIVNASRCQLNVFDKKHESHADIPKAQRVLKGLGTKVSLGALRRFYKAFLSEEKDIENLLLRYVQYAFSNQLLIEHDYSNQHVLRLSQIARKVEREKHRMEAFVRFQLTADKLYYAVCQPDFNVLPLIEKHFKNRYANQRWLIYDSNRAYGIYYNLEKVDTVQLSFNEETERGKNLALILDEKELLYQQLWQQYFKSVNIAARKNTRLHIQHMPRRYWKYLTEKQLAGS